MINEDKKWYKLDNAAKLYPAIKRRRWTAVFRISAKLTEPVDKQLLQQALDITLPRMSVFSCKLKTGLFWYYFDKNPEKALVTDDVINPCIKLYRKTSSGYLFRLRSHGNSVALEIFHSLSDGYGGIIFLKTLLAQYFTLKGHVIPATEGILDCTQSIKPEEVEDGFLKSYNKKATRSWKENKAYQIKGTSQSGAYS